MFWVGQRWRGFARRAGKLQSLPGHEGYFWSNVLAAVFGGFFVVAVAASNMKLDQPGEHHMATMKVRARCGAGSGGASKLPFF